MGSIWVLAGAGLRGRRRSGLVATFVVLVLAAVAMAAGLVVARQGAPVLDAAADDADVAHLVVYGDAEAIETLAADPEVRAWSGPFATLPELELLAGDEVVPMRVTALDSPDIAVNRPPITAGIWAAGPDDIVLDRSLAADLGLAVGDDVVFRLAGDETSLTVAGTAVDFTDCLYPQCEPGRAWVTTEGLARFAAPEDVISQGWLRFDDPAQADPFLQRVAGAGTTGIGGSDSWLDTRDDFLVLDRVFGAMVTAFGVFVLAVAAVVVAGSMAVRIVTRRREVGLLGAVGCTPRQVVGGFLLENVGLGALAALVGWLLAGFLAPMLQIGIGRTFGPQDPSWSAFGLVVCVLATSAILVLATAAPAWSAARRPVTDVLRNVPNERTSWLNRRTTRLPRRLSMLGVREAASRPGRGALAALAIVVAVVGAIVASGFVGGIERIADDPARAGDPWDVAVIPGEATSRADVEAELDDTDGVSAWFSEVNRRSVLDEGAFLSVATGGDPDAAAYRIVEGRPMEAEGDGIAGYGFLQRFDVDVGDEVTFLAGTTPVTVEIVGWYRDTEDSGEILRYRLETLESADPAAVADVYRVTAAAEVDGSALGSDLVDRLGSDVRFEVLDTGVADMAPMLAALRLVALILLLLAGVNLLSTMLTASRESAGRIGVQLAVGFTPRQVVAQGAAAGAAIGLVAAALGVPLGYWLFGVLSDVVSSGLGVGPGWMPAPSIPGVTIIAALAVLSSAVIGGLTVGGITRRPPSDLVRDE